MGGAGRAAYRRRLTTQRLKRDDHGRPEEEDLQSQEPQPAGLELDPVGPAPQRLPAVPPGQAAPRGVPELRLVRRPPGHRRRVTTPEMYTNPLMQRVSVHLAHRAS